MSARAVPVTARLVEMARDPGLTPRDQHAAFAGLVERTQHVVFGLALASLRDVEEAKDAAQEAFMTAWLRLRQLRDPCAFPAWLGRIVATHCGRRLRSRPARQPVVTQDEPAADARGRADDDSLIAAAVAALDEGERHVVVLHYFLGHTQEEVASLLRLKTGTVGKRLHSARLRIRRRLPPSVRKTFVRAEPSRSFLEKVRLGLFDEYVGRYRFDRRPDLVVTIKRRGDSLVSLANGQRHVLASLADDTLVTSHYDGEARFRRDRRGRITGFVYYEFGRRLGCAKKTAGAAPARRSR